MTGKYVMKVILISSFDILDKFPFVTTFSSYDFATQQYSLKSKPSL